jgi:hypothetical protein
MVTTNNIEQNKTYPKQPNTYHYHTNWFIGFFPTDRSQHGKYFDAICGKISLRAGFIKQTGDVTHFATEEKMKNKVGDALCEMFSHVKCLAFFLSICIIAAIEKDSKVNYNEKNSKKLLLFTFTENEEYKSQKKRSLTSHL